MNLFLWLSGCHSMGSPAGADSLIVALHQKGVVERALLAGGEL